ncbi:MAG: hypothetical protein LUO85_03400 [Methanomassiliicoccales archaeon]|nr:hypothetical protein [Methanomassiliicoccales archaeon]
MPTEKRISRDETLESIIEGRKMEAYAEHMTKEMHSCWICEKVCYKSPMRNIGGRYICFDCLKQLKEAFSSLDKWEAEQQLEKEMRKKIDDSLKM